MCGRGASTLLETGAQPGSLNHLLGLQFLHLIGCINSAVSADQSP